jgi:hypothetical protein
MSDVYDRETWQCNGAHSSGALVVAGNLRLTFTQCGVVNTYCVFTDALGNVLKDTCTRFKWLVNEGIVPAQTAITARAWRVAGEPTQEKVTYFSILRNQAGDFPFDLAFNWNDISLYGGWWTTGCTTFWWRTYTWRTPVGCNWFYQY